MRKTIWLMAAALALSGCSVLYTDEKAMGSGGSGASSASSSSATTGTSGTSASSGTGATSSSGGSTATGTVEGSSGGSSAGSGSTGGQLTCDTSEVSPPISGQALQGDIVPVAAVADRQFGVAYVDQTGNLAVGIAKYDGTWISPPFDVTSCSVGCPLQWPRFATGNTAPYAFGVEQQNGTATILGLSASRSGPVGSLQIPPGGAWDVTSYGGQFAAAEVSPNDGNMVFGSADPDGGLHSPTAETWHHGNEMRTITDLGGGPTFYGVLDPADGGGLFIGPINTSGGFGLPLQVIPTPRLPPQPGSLGLSVNDGVFFAAFLDGSSALHAANVTPGGPPSQLGPVNAIGKTFVNPNPRTPLGVAVGAGLELAGYDACDSAGTNCQADVAGFAPDGGFLGSLSLGLSAAKVHPQVAYDPGSAEFAVGWVDSSSSPHLTFLSNCH